MSLDLKNIFNINAGKIILIVLLAVVGMELGVIEVIGE